MNQSHQFIDVYVHHEHTLLVQCGHHKNHVLDLFRFYNLKCHNHLKYEFYNTILDKFELYNTNNSEMVSDYII